MSFIFEKASSHFVVNYILSFFFQGSEEEESLIICTREEARQGDKANCKKLHFFDVGGACYIDDFLELIPIGLYAFLCQHENKELPRFDLERALGGIQVHVVFFDELQAILQICSMATPFSSFYNYVVYIDLQVLPYLVEKHNIHESLVGGTIVLKAE